MDNNLSLLLKLYEEEKTRLEALIKACLEDFEGPDYLTAHSYQKALYRVQLTIRTFNRLDDKHFDKKQHYLNLMARYENDIEATDSENMKIYFSGVLQEYKEKLEDLNAIVPSAESQTNAGILEKALADLVSKKIKKFKIIFNKSEGISLELSAKGQVIKIVSSFIKKKDINSLQLGLLQKLGFEFTKRQKLVCQIENVDDSTLIKLRFLLTKIVFEVYYFRHPAKENYLEF